MDTSSVQEQVREIAHRFAQERHARQRRRSLDPADFARLRDTGFLRAAVPVDQGGLWEGVPRSIRPIAEMLRILAGGDASVALVAAMHPSVLAFWLAVPQAPEPYTEAWAQQRRHVFQTAYDGDWWGTITSEPGSGGDISRTRAQAHLVSADGAYRLTGQKHFGSGSGVTSYMLTAAVPEGEAQADLFYLDMRGVPWDGSTGVSLAAEWDGHGMTATQSHGMRFENFPTIRFAWPNNLQPIAAAANGAIGCCFAAVIVGIVETATKTAAKQLASWHTSMRSYEEVEWTRAEMETWLIQQAFEGMLAAVETQKPTAVREVLQGKTAIAELAETVLRRICRVVGGGSFARHSPFGFWLEDVRALGFLRPPWGLAYENLFKSSWPDTPSG
ncbi:MAG: acyl-CoA/acyl-ACP dehydrogenase [Caldilineaceae bacterium]|nr:acyl-CoA/acyl-ACP dehydrogenase [Caldilineaceae bacterium]